MQELEKKYLMNLLIGARMREFRYGETFQLIFNKDYFQHEWKQFAMVLNIDASCWFGDRDEWQKQVEEYQIGESFSEKEDCLLASELVRLKYWNLIDVEFVELTDGCLQIIFSGENTLSIACEGNTEGDCEWMLQELNDKPEHERMMICCQANTFYQDKVPEVFLSVRIVVCDD